MLIPAPIKFRRQRRPLKRTPPSSPPPPPPIHPGLMITQVTPTDPSTHITVWFSDTMNWDYSGPPTAFAAMTSNGIMEPCIAVAAADHLWIELIFPADVALGAAWELTDAMEGISPDVAWPQAGIVTSG